MARRSIWHRQPEVLGCSGLVSPCRGARAGSPLLLSRHYAPLSVQHRVGAPRTPSPLSSHHPTMYGTTVVLCVRTPVALCTLNVIIQLNSRDLSKQGQQ